MTTASLGLRLWVEVERVQEGESWSAFCDALHLASAGDTQEEAVRNLRNAIQAYAGVMNRNGVLEQVLSDKDVEFESLTTDKAIPTDKIPVDIMDEATLVS